MSRGKYPGGRHTQEGRYTQGCRYTYQLHTYPLPPTVSLIVATKAGGKHLTGMLSCCTF